MGCVDTLGEGLGQVFNRIAQAEISEPWGRRKWTLTRPTHGMTTGTFDARILGAPLFGRDICGEPNSFNFERGGRCFGRQAFTPDKRDEAA